MNKSHINRDAYGRDNSNRGRVRFGLIAVILALSGIALLTVWREGRSQENSAAEGTSELSDELSNEMQFEYGEYLKRALPYGIPSMARTHALQQMKAMAEANLQPRGGTGKSAPEGGPSAIQWSPLGPQPILHGQGLSAVGFCGTAPRLHASGRATAIAFGALPSTVYLGTANGGVWKSIDGGAFWTVLTDKEPSLAVGALAVVPNANTARDVIYAGTGEGNQGCDSEFGQGILKSTDGGHSWTQLGEPTPFDRMTFTRIAVAPKAGAAGQDVLYAGTRTGFTNSAAFICLGAMSINPGLFKSTDGGVTWIQMSGSGGLPAAGGDPGAATDLVLDPANSNTVYVAIAGTKSNSGGLWKSTDGGASWTQFTAAKNHFPQAAARINLDISADGSSLWAARTADGSTFDNVYLSTNRGATWTAGGGALPKIGATGCLTENQEFYDMVVRGEPSGFANTVLLGLTGIYRSTDRGTKWTFIGTGIHGDFHDLAIVPEGIFAANDGGLFLSPNDGIAWDSSPNDQLSITQFQSVALPPSGTGMIGGTQDNGTNVFTAGLGWEHGDDGDGGYTAIDPSSPNIVFAEHFNTTSALSLDRSSSAGSLGSFTNIAPPLGDPVSFYAPFAEDPTNPDRVLFGTNRIWESCNVSSKPIVCNGTSGTPPAWSDISAGSQPGGLTAGCKTAFCQLTDIQIAPTNPDVVYACSGADGIVGSKMWTTLNGRSPSPTWVDITAGLPSAVPFTSIAVSPFNPPHVLLGVSGFNASGSHVFYSSNATSLHPTWTDISAANPTCTASNSCFPDIPVSAVLIDKTDATEKTYLAGTDIGVFITQDAGATWQKFDTGTLPAVPIYMLRQNPIGIVAATHGRGIWSIPKNGPVNLSSFNYTGSMNSIRSDHTATLLKDGRVLVTGGLAVLANETTSAEIYDPATGRFSVTGSMFDARFEHEAVLLNNGMVLVEGGDSTGNQLSSVELFDPAGGGGIGSFTPTASMSVPRIVSTATLLADGRVLIAGGDYNSSGYPGTAEIFDPAGNGGAGSFAPPLPMIKWRGWHTATLLADGRVLIAGGVTANFADENTAEIFDPTAHGGVGGFTATGNMVNRRFLHTAVRLLDGRVLVAGHYNPAEIFDPKGNGGVGSFSSAGNLNVERDYASGHLLFDGTVLVAGGTTSVYGSPGGATAAAEVFDPARAGTANAFTLTGSMNEARYRFAGVTLLNGSVLVTGGVSASDTGLSSAELYQPVGLPVATQTATATSTATSTPTPALTPKPSPTATATARPTATATQTPTPTATQTPTPTATATAIPGTPFIASIPKVILVGGSFVVKGTGFTVGSVINFFLPTPGGAVNAGPLTPTARSLPTQLTVSVPTTITLARKVVPMPLGQGFVDVVVVNTDKGFLSSNAVGALLQGNPADGIPSITGINGVPLAATSSDPSYATNNVETVVARGKVVTLGGMGFDTANGVAVDLFCACSPLGKVGPFLFGPGSAGLSKTAISFVVPATGAMAPATGPGSFVVSNKGPDGKYSKKSNAVSAPIGSALTILPAPNGVMQNKSTITVNGSGFSTLTVINFFNAQSGGVANLGGLDPKTGLAKIPLTIVNEDKFTFTVPAGAVPGPIYVQALNPPFVPFSSTGNAPGGALTLWATSTALASSPNPSTVGQPVTLTATVTPATLAVSGAPTGTVTFKDGGAVLGTGTLAGAKATLLTSKLAKGSHSITAEYGGSASYFSSTSAALPQIVH